MILVMSLDRILGLIQEYVRSNVHRKWLLVTAVETQIYTTIGIQVSKDANMLQRYKTQDWLCRFCEWMVHTDTIQKYCTFISSIT